MKQKDQLSQRGGALPPQACNFPLTNLKTHLIIRISKGQGVDGKRETIGKSCSLTITRADEALSAMVSTSAMRQLRMRLSTTSRAADTPRVACKTCSSVTPGPCRSEASQKAISGSMRG